MQQRYYDPIAGRFLSVDPVVTDANTGKGFGLYTYVDNNPYAKIDPDGRQAAPNVFPNFDPMQYLKDLAQESIKFVSTASLGAGGAAPKVVEGTATLLKAGEATSTVASATSKAAAEASAVGTKGASGELTTASGSKYLGNSTGSSASGGSARAPTNPETAKALEGVQNPSRTHGHCCEIDAINKALNAGENLKGATMGPVKLNETGRILPACSTCREVKSYFQFSEAR